MSSCGRTGSGGSAERVNGTASEAVTVHGSLSVRGLSHQALDPALLRALLESRAERAEVGEARVEHHGVLGDRPRLHELGNPVPRRALHLRVAVAIEYLASADEAGTHFRFESLEHAEQSVDRAARGAGGALIHG